MSMQILSHRGYWLTSEEKNTDVAFKRSFTQGFGTETDLRDCAGELLIAHDPPSGKEMSFAQLLEIHKTCASGQCPLALNIKADGLQKWILRQTQAQDIRDYFLFDMSVPDALVCIQDGLPVFTRQSEYERQPAFYDKAIGVWVDAFHSRWYDEATLEKHVQADKQVCLVSDELHLRDPIPLWNWLKALPSAIRNRLMLCTDLPQQAQEFLG
jgi:hypothetical protein